MKVPSNILAAFLPKGGQLAPEEGILTIPPTVFMTAELAEPPSTFIVLANPVADIATVYNTSFFLTLSHALSNSGALTRVIGALGPGVWELDMGWYHSLDTAVLTAGSVRAQWRMSDGSAVGLIDSITEVVGQYANSRKMRLNIPASLPNGYQLSYVESTTTVAQHAYLFWSINARRLG